MAEAQELQFEQAVAEAPTGTERRGQKTDRYRKTRTENRAGTESANSKTQKSTNNKIKNKGEI